MIETISRKNSGIFMLKNVFSWNYSAIILCTILSIAATIAILSLKTPKYTATASLLLDVRRSQPTIDAQVNSPVDSSVIETQIEILKSDAVAIAVMDTLNLWGDPEFKGGGGLLTRVFEFFGTPTPKSGRETELKAFQTN